MAKPVYDLSKVKSLYDVIVIDPPWDVKKVPYKTQHVNQIVTLQPPAKKDCHFFLWTTHKFLPDALKILQSWEYKYRCMFVWHKTKGMQPKGYPCYNSEFAVYATKGKPKFMDTSVFYTCFSGEVNKHSAKPECFYSTIRRVTDGKGIKRLDMFNRRPIDGFDGWGDQTGWFPSQSTMTIKGVWYRMIMGNKAIEDNKPKTVLCTTSKLSNFEKNIEYMVDGDFVIDMLGEKVRVNHKYFKTVK